MKKFFSKKYLKKNGEEEDEITRLFNQMYKECLRHLREFGYVPERRDVVLNSKKLRDMIWSGCILPEYVSGVYAMVCEELIIGKKHLFKTKVFNKPDKNNDE